MLNDPLANVMSNIRNATGSGKTFCKAAPSSKVIAAVLKIMQDNHYIGGFDVVNNGRGGIVTIQLIGGINNCGAIKPRFSVKKDDYEKFEKRYLPAKNFGIIIVSTSKGIMTHVKAEEKKLGGKVLAYVY